MQRRTVWSEDANGACALIRGALRTVHRRRAGSGALAMGAESRRPRAGSAAVRSCSRQSVELLAARGAGAQVRDALHAVFAPGLRHANREAGQDAAESCGRSDMPWSGRHLREGS